MDRRDKRLLLETGLTMVAIAATTVILAQVVGWVKALVDTGSAGVLGTIVYALLHNRIWNRPGGGPKGGPPDDGQESSQ